MYPSQSPSSPQSGEPNMSLEDESSPVSSARSASAAMARRRRKRMAIELPADQVNALNKDEVKKWKNRIAAARARERTQTQVQELQGMVDRLWRENQQQKALIDHLKGVIHTLRPNYDYSTNYAGGGGVATTEPMAAFTPEPIPFYAGANTMVTGAELHYSAGGSAMTNGILAELGDPTWMFSSQSQE